MKENFVTSLLLVLKHEGGFVNHPKDPGGATNKGVTQKVYDIWRINEGLKTQSVKLIRQDEIGSIYRQDYWNACKCDTLPVGVDYCVFDFAVNSGVSRAKKFLQRALNVQADGLIGPMTLNAAKAFPAKDLIDKICNSRLEFLRGLNTFPTFGKGWTRRVEEVRVGAKAMVKGI